MDEDQTMAMGLEADLDGIPCPPSIQRWLGTLSTDLLAILQRFAKAGHGVWLVGGCVAMRTWATVQRTSISALHARLSKP